MGHISTIHAIYVVEISTRCFNGANEIRANEATIE